jgi:hypothetical protein
VRADEFVAKKRAQAEEEKKKAEEAALEAQIASEASEAD